MFSAWGVPLIRLGSRHDRYRSNMSPPPVSFQRLLDEIDRVFELRIGRIEMRRDPDAGVPSEINDDISRQQELRNLVRVGNIEGHGPAATGGVAWRPHGVPPGI